MEHLMDDFYHLFTTAGALALLNIIIIDIVMSGDNAIIIGMATRNLDEKYRKKAIMIGIVLATILRIILAFFAVFLLQIVGLKLAGGVLLLYVVWSFYRELRNTTGHDEEAGNKKPATFMSAITTIVLADVSMSLDNVLAVSGASHGNVVTLGIGLVVSILLMAFASNFIAGKLEKYPQIQWVGLFVILFVAIEMVLNGTLEIGNKIAIPHLLPMVIFGVGSIFVILHARYISGIEEEKLLAFLQKNYLGIFIVMIFLLISLLFFGEKVSTFLHSHHVWFYSALLVLVGVIMELFSLMKKSKKIKKS